MPVNGQSIGKDVSLNMVVASAVFPVEPNAITSFEPTPVTTQESRKGLDGFSRHAVYPDSWKGSLEIDRLSPVVERMWAAFENAYFSGQNTGSGTITETISNPDGSQSQYRYIGVVFNLETLGQRVADQVIKQRLSFLASRRIQVQ